MSDVEFSHSGLMLGERPIEEAQTDPADNALGREHKGPLPEPISFWTGATSDGFGVEVFQFGKGWATIPYSLVVHVLDHYDPKYTSTQDAARFLGTDELHEIICKVLPLGTVVVLPPLVSAPEPLPREPTHTMVCLIQGGGIQGTPAGARWTLTEGVQPVAPS